MGGATASLKMLGYLIPLNKGIGSRCFWLPCIPLHGPLPGGPHTGRTDGLQLETQRKLVWCWIRPLQHGTETQTLASILALLKVKWDFSGGTEGNGTLGNSGVSLHTNKNHSLSCAHLRKFFFLDCPLPGATGGDEDLSPLVTTGLRVI